MLFFFEYERQNKTLMIYLRGPRLKEQKRLFEKIIDIEINNGSELSNYATKWYKKHLDQFLKFA